MVEKEAECPHCKGKLIVDARPEGVKKLEIEVPQIHSSGNATVQAVVEQATSMTKDPHAPTLKDSKLPKHLKDFYCPDCGLHKNNVHGSYEKPKRYCKTCGNTMNEDNCPLCNAKTRKIEHVETVDPSEEKDDEEEDEEDGD